MIEIYKIGSHTQYDIEYHIVWPTKYRYKVLKGNVSERLRELIRQGCFSPKKASFSRNTSRVL